MNPVVALFGNPDDQRLMDMDVNVGWDCTSYFQKLMIQKTKENKKQ